MSLIKTQLTPPIRAQLTPSIKRHKLSPQLRGTINAQLRGTINAFLLETGFPTDPGTAVVATLGHHLCAISLAHDRFDQN